jgi:hypothetical protein
MAYHIPQSAPAGAANTHDATVLAGIEILENALAAAARLDTEGKHEDAALLLRGSIPASNSDYHPQMSEVLLIRYAGLAQKVGREAEEQRRKLFRLVDHAAEYGASYVGR